jgi:hypothetical protein
MLRSAFRTPSSALSSSSGVAACASAVASCFGAMRGKKFIQVPSAAWEPEHEDINAHVKQRLPGETRDERSKRFAREWRNVELELGIHKDSRGRELRYRKTYVFRYTYPNSFDTHW